MTTRTIHIVLCVLALAGCGGASATTDTTTTPQAAAADTTSLEAVIAGEHRSEENRARDRYRHPRETLEFFGIQPTMTVVEMAPGAGWYTEILAPYLREHGRLIAAAPDPSGEYGQRFDAFLATRPDLYDRVERIVFNPPEQVSLGPDESADMVVTFRSVHGWINRNQAEQVFEAMFRVLKPGGVLGLVQHRGPEGIDTQTGYVPESTVIRLAEAAGFVLEERSEINANPADDHDHPQGVWSLPPTLSGGDQSLVAVGESDRMTLRFRKPAAQ